MDIPKNTRYSPPEDALAAFRWGSWGSDRGKGILFNNFWKIISNQQNVFVGPSYAEEKIPAV
jgi:hypothetical protein